ncbi:MAG: sensor histidine kinase [Chloroflexota bacterium]
MPKSGFFTLVPPRVQFEGFWATIKRRNRWLIKLRFGAVALLCALIVAIEALENSLNGFSLDTTPHWIIAGGILGYNLVFRRVWNRLDTYKKFHSMHLSLLQICFDLAALMLFIYFTGGVETPLFLFFIFHTILGALFLPAPIIFLIFTCVVGCALAASLLELNGAIPHHAVQGLLPFTLYDNPVYVAVFFTLFAVSIFLSIYLTNSVARELYERHRDQWMINRRLEEVEVAKTKYVMSVVHDLKTPIAAVITYVNMLLDGTLGEMNPLQKRPLERSRIRLTNAIAIINDILQIAYIKIDKDKLDIQAINLILFLRETSEEYFDLARSKELIYEIENLTQREIFVNCEPKLLKLALSNLISNAIKYTEEGGRVSVSAASEAGRVVLIFADTGIGIPQAEISKVFDDFYRSTISKKKGIEGTGLGMSIVKQIIERFGGTIKIVSPSHISPSEDKPGTDVIVDLPAALVAAAQPETSRT